MNSRDRAEKALCNTTLGGQREVILDRVSGAIEAAFLEGKSIQIEVKQNGDVQIDIYAEIGAAYEGVLVREDEQADSILIHIPEGRTSEDVFSAFIAEMSARFPDDMVPILRSDPDEVDEVDEVDESPVELRGLNLALDAVLSELGKTQSGPARRALQAVEAAINTRREALKVVVE